MVKSRFPIEKYKYCSKCKLKFPIEHKAWCVVKYRAPAPLMSCADFMTKEKLREYKVIFEIMATIDADNIDEVEKQLKNRFNKTDLKFRQLIDYQEIIR